MLEEMRRNISLAELAKNAERIADDIDASGAVYCVKRRGKAGIMLIDADHYEGWRADIQRMLDAHWRERLAQAERDFAAGRGRDLAEVARELGLDRPAQPRRRGATTKSARASSPKTHARASRARDRAAQRTLRR
jgi:PHD/YefM family antitoxin component YafN of YafNO toxin-antitoxin module